MASTVSVMCNKTSCSGEKLKLGISVCPLRDIYSRKKCSTFQGACINSYSLSNVEKGATKCSQENK